MNSANPKPGKGIIEAILDDNISDQEMDRALADQRDEIDAKLKQARDEMVRGEVAPLEPLHVFLHEARTRFKAGR
ncbi:MAG TPA: hypothetical protein VG960_05820 [Caulobacteraceae bacterium]|nr:hypothetical protein [Caulobacteraceae bacterium]